HSAPSSAVSVSARRRTRGNGTSPAKNSRALSWRICWLSLNPNCIWDPLVAARQAEDEVSDDVALDFRRARFDRVAAGAQVAVRPLAVVDRALVTGRQLT